MVWVASVRVSSHRKPTAGAVSPNAGLSAACAAARGRDGEGGDAGLGRGVVGLADRAEQERLRGGVDDPGVDLTAGRLPRLPPVGGGEARGHEVPAQVDPDDQVPLFGGHREDHPVPHLARAAEQAGYDSMVVPDSICYPRHAVSQYPFSPDGSREFLEDKPFLEPFSLIPALGAVTSRLRFVTFVLKLPVRDPVLVAKQATSTAVLTGGRLVLGTGVSPWREDYEVLGVDWASRGQRMDESIAILRGLAAGGYFEFHGKIFDPPPVKIAPVPSDPIPVLIGGHSDAALRRAARLGDGWLHGGGDPADLPGLLTRLAGFRREEGTAERPFEVHVISAEAYTVDGVRRLAEAGVTDLIVGFRWPYVTGPDTEPLELKLASLRRFADTIIAQV